jgi:site-specific recombinase XerD
MQVRILDAWVSAMRDEGKARSTVNTRWRAMRAVFKRIAEQDGVINPFLFIRAPHPGDARLECLTPDAAAQVVLFALNEPARPTFVRTRNAALLGVMLLAGLRKRETLSLRIADVDMREEQITVRAGKGRHGGKPRTVPITDQLLSLCSAYISAREEHDKAAESAGVIAFFVGTRGTRALSDTTLKRVFARISRATGIHVSPHMLRHTFCTLLSRSGVPDRLAREAMGHADLRMLQRYQHVYPGELATEMRKLHLDL